MGQASKPGVGASAGAPDPLLILKTLAGALAGQSLLAALATAAAYSATKLPARMFLLPFILLAWCGILLGIGLHLASLEHSRPRVFAQRMGLTIFVYSEACVLAVVFGLVRLGIETEQEALTGTLPFWANAASLWSLGLYLMFRRRAKRLEAASPTPHDRS